MPNLTNSSSFSIDPSKTFSSALIAIFVCAFLAIVMASWAVLSAALASYHVAVAPFRIAVKLFRGREVQ